MRTSQFRPSFPTAAQIAAAIGARKYGQWYRTMGFCHGKTARSNTTLAFRDLEAGYVQVTCHASCTDGQGWRTVRDELLRRAGYEPGRFAARPQAPAAAVHVKPAQPARQDPVDAILDALVTVPGRSDHPARLWAATKEEGKELVAEDSPFPASIGWIDRPGLIRMSRAGTSPAHRMYRHFRGAGALVMPFAPYAAWNERLRPARPDVCGVQLVHLNASGAKYRLWSDSDDGGDGRIAATKPAQRLANAGMNASVERPPRGYDPASAPLTAASSAAR